MTDDHGDQFPGALPARPDSARSLRTGGEKRLVRMPATPVRTHGRRPPGQAATGLARMSRFTRRSLARFDRYTLEVFNPAPPFRPHADRQAPRAQA